jgi:hypothetical protein
MTLSTPAGEAGLLGELGEHDGGAGVALRGLENKGVAAGDGERKHPERNHCGKVERGDAGADAERLLVRVDVDVGGDVVKRFAHLESADGGRVLDHLETTKDVALGVGKGLAVLLDDAGGNLVLVATNQRLQLEHQTRTHANRSVSPRLECVAGGAHGGLHFLLRRFGRTRHHFLSRRVVNIDPVVGG